MSKITNDLTRGLAQLYPYGNSGRQMVKFLSIFAAPCMLVARTHAVDTVCFPAAWCRCQVGRSGWRCRQTSVSPSLTHVLQPGGGVERVDAATSTAGYC